MSERRLSCENHCTQSFHSVIHCWPLAAMLHTHTHAHTHARARTHARTHSRARTDTHTRPHSRARTPTLTCARTHEVELMSLGGGGGGTNYCMALGCIYIYVYVYACIYMTNMYVGMVIPEPKMIGQFRDDAFSVPPITNSIASTTIPTYMCSYI